MHVSILLGMILLLCGGNHRLAAALGLPAAAFFIVMTGAPASAVRAGVMQALVLCAPLVRRENDPPTTICAAASRSACAKPMVASERGSAAFVCINDGNRFLCGQTLPEPFGKSAACTSAAEKDGVQRAPAHHADGALLHDLVYGIRASHYGDPVWNRLACCAGRERDGAVDALYRFLRRNAYGTARAGASGGSWCLHGRSAGRCGWCC